VPITAAGRLTGAMFSFQVWMDEDEDIALDNRVGSPTHWKQIERVFDWTQVRPKTKRRDLNPIITRNSFRVCFAANTTCVACRFRSR